ncbi:MAG TPA: DUF5320 domain-containing protein [Syntrophobacteraceae bacterium]|nr:DUF5320 domain-containing protein [Syntrophobacteraceae bacterium]
MPGGDRTGPRGLGPMTGRGLGWCRSAWGGGTPGGGYGPPGAFGCGFGFGRGRGWRHCYTATGLPGWARAGRGWFGGTGYAAWSPQDELNYLRDYTQGLEQALTETRMRMAEIEKAQQGD